MANLTFPSTEWFEKLAAITREDEAYRKFGRLNAVVVFKIGEKHIKANFDVLNIHEIAEVDPEFSRDADFVIELEPGQWREMLDDIKQNGHASQEWTLNTLDLRLDDPIHTNLMEDGFKADMFFRYNPSLQRFFDNASQLEYVFDMEAATA
ncbi:MAG: hypothetical protein GEU80_06070 [Dehalococcoidia bacterium]|nr:hypothetical protein [Dehalococcoidia bacterium]